MTTEIVGATIKIEHPQAGMVEASLFIISLKSPRLKIVNLNALASLDEAARSVKLEKWKAAHRFVSVIELVDKIYIEANQKYVEKLQNPKELVIEGKDIDVEGKSFEVKSLKDEESEEFFKSIQHIFTTTVVPPAQDPEDKKVAAPAKSPANSSLLGLNRGTITRPVDQLLVNFTLGFSKIVNKILDNMRESNEEDRVQQKRSEERRRIERENLKDDILKDEIKSDRIKTEEIKKKTIPVR